MTIQHPETPENDIPKQLASPVRRALAAAGCRVNRIVRDTQLAFAQEGEREAIVVKLYGCLSDPESLQAFSIRPYSLAN